MFFVWTLVLHSPFINYDWLRNELLMRSTNQMQNLNLFNLPCFSALKQFAFFRHEFSVAHRDYFSLWFVALIKCSFTIIIQKALQNDCSLVFYRAFARLRVFTLSSLVMFTCHLIGWCKYFEFGFAALIENALCRVFSLYSWVVGYSHKKSSYTTFIWLGWTELGGVTGFQRERTGINRRQQGNNVSRAFITKTFFSLFFFFIDVNLI